MSDPTEREIRLRCIEAAAKAPIVHASGPAAGVVETARAWATWAISGDVQPTPAGARPILGAKKP